MKIRLVAAEVFHADGGTDGRMDKHDEIDIFLTVHHSYK